MTHQELLAIAKKTSGFPSGDGSGNDRFHDGGRKAMFWGNLVIFAGLGTFLAWAALAPLDQGVPAAGTVVVESMRKTVTHASGGTIDSILVRENQRVNSGDVLITLKTDKAKTAYDTALQEYLAASAQLARLRAEQTNASTIEFPEDIYNLAEENGRLETLRAEQDLFLVRRQTLTSELAILRENISASGQQISGMRRQIAAKDQQLHLLREEAQAMKPLAENGYSARNSMFEYERRIAEMQSSRSELETRIAREESTSAELRLRLLQRRQEFMRDVETQLTEAGNAVLKWQGQFADARSDLESKQIKAPVSGQVVSLQMHTPGAAINAGAKILDIVPQNETLLVDIRIPVQNISSVVEGQPVDIGISAFAGHVQMIIPGTLVSVSSDIHEPDAPQELPYYLGRVAVTSEGREMLGTNHLLPGMSVYVIVKTGERSLIAYLLRPVLKQFFYALKEE